jgi:hypothetical protein
MANPLIGGPDDTASSELITLLASWRRHLTAQRMSPATLDTYSASVRGLNRFLDSGGVSRSATDLRRYVQASVIKRWWRSPDGARGSASPQPPEIQTFPATQ